MRLIDADELKKKIRRCDDSATRATFDYVYDDDIDDAPTVDVLEQIRAEIEQAKTIEIKTDDTAFKVSADVVINPQYRNFTSGLDIALQIIDKYMKGDTDE